MIPTMKRYSLNVSRDVYVKLMELRNKELIKTGHVPTVDLILRKHLHLSLPEPQPATSKEPA